MDFKFQHMPKKTPPKSRQLKKDVQRVLPKTENNPPQLPRVTATAVVFGYTALGVNMPLKQYQQYPSHYDNTVLTQTEHISVADKVEILHNFSKSILGNIKDIDPKYSALVDEEFWDLL